MAGLAAFKSRPADALRLAGAAAAIREHIGAPLFPVGQVRLDRWLGPARLLLGTEVATAAWATGHAMSPREALAANAEASPASSGSSGGQSI